MPRENRISRASLMAELDQQLERSGEGQMNKEKRRLSFQSAAFLLGDPAKPPDKDLLDREQAVKLAGQIMRKSDPNYMEWNYGGLREGETPRHFEGMLLQTLEGLHLPEGIDRAGKREAIRRRVEERGPTYAEYLLLNTVRPPGAAEYREKDEPGPENPVPEKTCKVFAAFTHCMSRNAGMPALRGADFAREAEIYSGMPLCRLSLRNRRTAEMLERREFGNVAKALKKTQASFQFADKEDFHEAQKGMKKLLGRMNTLEGEGTGGKAWEDLNRAARGFTKARQFNDVDAVAGAKLFLAAEAYLLEQKDAPPGPGTELALAVLGTGVPDAARNPDVKALMGELNARRAPEQALALPDNGAPSVASQPGKETKGRQTEVVYPVPARNPELSL